MRSGFVSSAAAGLLMLGAVASASASTPTRESTGQYLDDPAITVEVNNAFVRDPELKSMHITVTTFNGVVVLSGPTRRPRNCSSRQTQEEATGTVLVPGNSSCRNSRTTPGCGFA